MTKEEAMDGLTDEDPIRCCVRIRPLNRNEKKKMADMKSSTDVCLSVHKDNQTIHYLHSSNPSSRTNSASSQQGGSNKKSSGYANKNSRVNSTPNTPTEKTGKKTFTFDRVIHEKSSQEEVFEMSGIRDLIDFALEGFSTTIFAYGQTGSGKTYTISGEDSNSQLRGIVPRCGEYLFKQIQQKTKESSIGSIYQPFRCVYKVRASYLEIWNEHINDLLNLQSTNLPVRWSQQEGFFVENLYVIQCSDLEDYMAILSEGVSNRKVATHDLNMDSSRSHSIFTVYIDIEYMDESEMAVTKRGKIQIVDLAGSERLKESNSSGNTAVETGHINKSLLTLGKVINVLSDSRKLQDNAYVPYRDSKLTMLLMDSIGGSSKTVMIACVTPSIIYAEETLNTLLYAKRVKNIRNKPIINIDPHEAYVLELKSQIKLLQDELALLKSTSPPSVNNSMASNQSLPDHPPPKYEEIVRSGDMSINSLQASTESLKLPPIARIGSTADPHPSSTETSDVRMDRRRARTFGKLGEAYYAMNEPIERDAVFPIPKQSSIDPQYIQFVAMKQKMEEEIRNLKQAVEKHRPRVDDPRFSHASSYRPPQLHMNNGSNNDAAVREEKLKREVFLLRNENLSLRKLCQAHGIDIPSEFNGTSSDRNDRDHRDFFSPEPTSRTSTSSFTSTTDSVDRMKPERTRPRAQPELIPFGGLSQLGRMNSEGDTSASSTHRHTPPVSSRSRQRMRETRAHNEGDLSFGTSVENSSQSTPSQTLVPQQQQQQPETQQVPNLEQHEEEKQETEASKEEIEVQNEVNLEEKQIEQELEEQLDKEKSEQKEPEHHQPDIGQNEIKEQPEETDLAMTENENKEEVRNEEKNDSSEQSPTIQEDKHEEESRPVEDPLTDEPQDLD